MSSGADWLREAHMSMNARCRSPNGATCLTVIFTLDHRRGRVEHDRAPSRADVAECNGAGKGTWTGGELVRLKVDVILCVGVGCQLKEGDEDFCGQHHDVHCPVIHRDRGWVWTDPKHGVQRAHVHRACFIENCMGMTGAIDVPELSQNLQVEHQRTNH